MAAADLDDLFKLPLDQFTAARNALAASLKKAGRAEEAERVRALPKPPISAWTVNQLFWRHRTAFDRLIAAGERFRRAQASQLAGKKGDLRAPLEARREALSELATRAATILREAGSGATLDTMRRITTTLEALATYGAHPDAPPAGRLTDDVHAPGFEALAALIPRAGRGARAAGAPTRVIPFRRAPAPRPGKAKKATAEQLAQQREAERKAAQAAAASRLRDAERTLRKARTAAGRAEAALKKAAARAKDADRAKAELEQRVEKAAAGADAARQEARRVASAAESAAQELEDAERAVEQARADLETIRGG